MKHKAALILAAILLRVACFWWLDADGLLPALAQRVELSSVVSSYKRLQECRYLLRHRFPLYDGGVCHHPPLLVLLVDTIFELGGSFHIPIFTSVHVSEWLVRLLYIYADVCIGMLLFRIASLSQEYHDLFFPSWKLFSKKRRDPLRSPSSPNDADGSSSSPPRSESPTKGKSAIAEARAYFREQVCDRTDTLNPTFIAAVYVLFTSKILLSNSTVLFTNLAITAAVLNALKGRGILCMFWVAFGTYLSLYPWMLLPALILLLRKSHQIIKHKRGYLVLYLHYVGVYAFWLFALSVGTLLFLAGPPPDRLWDRLKVAALNQDMTKVLELAGLAMNSVWLRQGILQFKSFLVGTYGVILTIPDLSPNIGLYWYFFTEFFDSFRSFFVAAVQLQLASFALPLTIKFREDPLFTVCLYTGMIAFFKSYPALGDVSFWIFGLLPLQRRLFPYFRNPFLSTNLLFFSTILLPAFHHIWIYAGSGNANFFYAITLLWGFGGVSMLTDLAFAWLRRAFDVHVYGENPALRGVDIKLQ